MFRYLESSEDISRKVILMYRAFLIKYSEIGIKGKNRYLFEDALCKNIREALSSCDGEFFVSKEQGRIYIEALSDYDYDETVTALSRVFGVAAICPVMLVDNKDWENVCNACIKHVGDRYADKNFTFKVEAQRGDKSYQYTSPEIGMHMGAVLLDNFPDMKVDVHNPSVRITIEIRKKAYIYSESIKGPCGMPIGTSGKAMLLLSGGIDSPVAGYMIAKRGVEIDAVYFETPPYTGDAAREKVMSLAKILAGYTGKIYVNTIPITEIQQAIADNCEEKYFTILLRRFMMRLAEKTAKNVGCSALVTGESVGQVASQTIEALYMTTAV